MPCIIVFPMEAFHHYPSINKLKTAKGQNGEMIPIERNSFDSPVNGRLLVNGPKLKLPPYPFLRSAFASPNRPNSGGGGEHLQRQGSMLSFGSKIAFGRLNSDNGGALVSDSLECGECQPSKRQLLTPSCWCSDLPTTLMKTEQPDNYF